MSVACLSLACPCLLSPSNTYLYLPIKLFTYFGRKPPACLPVVSSPVWSLVFLPPLWPFTSGLMYVFPAANTQLSEAEHGERFHIIPLYPVDHLIYRSLSLCCPFSTPFPERFAEAGSRQLPYYYSSCLLAFEPGLIKHLFFHEFLNLWLTDLVSSRAWISQFSTRGARAGLWILHHPIGGTIG